MGQNDNPGGGLKNPETQKNNGWKNWIIVVILIIAGFIGGFLIQELRIKNAMAIAAAQMKIADKTKNDLTAEKGNIAKLMAQITELENEIASLKARPTTIIKGGEGTSDAAALAAKNKHIASLEKLLAQCLSKGGVSADSGASGSGTGSEKNKNSIEPAFANASSATAKPQPATNNQFEEYYENGKIPFCVRLGGNSNRHLPHLVMRKLKFSDAESNGIGGFNWNLPGMTADLVGDHGCANGVFYVLAEIIENSMIPSDNGIVEVVAKAFEWGPIKMIKFGDFYISSNK